MKILCTVGTERFQFNAMMRMVDELAAHFPDARFAVQAGTCTELPATNDRVEVYRSLPQDEFRGLAEGCDVVISHCGEGNLLMLQAVGRPYIMVPRTVARKEHVDDHQMELAEFLATRGVPIATRVEELIAFLDAPRFSAFHWDLDDACRGLDALYGDARQVLVICSSGGHYHGMKLLAPFYRGKDVTWVTFRNPTTEAELAGQEVVWAYSPTNRNIPNLLRNIVLASSTLRRHRPDVVLTTGAGVAVPFVILAKLKGIKTVFVESITRLHNLSLSARMLRNAGSLDTLVVQSPELKRKYPKAIYA